MPKHLVGKISLNALERIILAFWHVDVANPFFLSQGIQLDIILENKFLFLKKMSLLYSGEFSCFIVFIVFVFIRECQLAF